MSDDLAAQLKTATDSILDSESPKKLIVAGPGAGKTFTFKRLLGRASGPASKPIVLTFINNLKNDLERDLAGLAQVFTFHAYCLKLLFESEALRDGLSDSLKPYPPLLNLIKRDWTVIYEGVAPQFWGMMRKPSTDPKIAFYIERANYYDAVSFDDSVFRVHNALKQDANRVPSYQLALVDEYQDFNQLEVSLINILATRSPIVVAGDDDQALYVNLRGSSPKYIREIYVSDEFEPFELPFSMRCTEPVVRAVNDVLAKANALGKLDGRIPKRYEYYPPLKAVDSDQCPVVKVIRTSVQSGPSNYFGKYIEREIRNISPEEIQESYDGNFPTILVIGSVQYRRQIQKHLESQGLRCDSNTREDVFDVDRVDALKLISQKREGNLGWRALLEIDEPPFFQSLMRRSITEKLPLYDLVPPEYRDGVLAEVEGLLSDAQVDLSAPTAEGLGDLPPTIRLTSFESSKGLSAQHVFIVGLHNKDLPGQP